MTRALLIPAFSTSSSSRRGVWPIRIASAMRSDRVWPPESEVIRMHSLIFSPVNSFASPTVRATRCSASVSRALMWSARNLSTVRSAITRVFWVMSAMGFFEGSRTRSSAGSAPFTRMLRPVAVSSWARTSMSLMNADFPDPVGPTMERVSPGRMTIRSNPSFAPSRVVPGRMVISYDLIHGTSADHGTGHTYTFANLPQYYYPYSNFINN